MLPCIISECIVIMHLPRSTILTRLRGDMQLFIVKYWLDSRFLARNFYAWIQSLIYECIERCIEDKNDKLSIENHICIFYKWIWIFLKFLRKNFFLKKEICSIRRNIVSERDIYWINIFEIWIFWKKTNRSNLNSKPNLQTQFIFFNFPTKEFHVQKSQNFLTSKWFRKITFKFEKRFSTSPLQFLKIELFEYNFPKENYRFKFNPFIQFSITTFWIRITRNSKLLNLKLSQNVVPILNYKHRQNSTFHLHHYFNDRNRE